MACDCVWCQLSFSFSLSLSPSNTILDFHYILSLSLYRLSFSFEVSFSSLLSQCCLLPIGPFQLFRLLGTFYFHSNLLHLRSFSSPPPPPPLPLPSPSSPSSLYPTPSPISIVDRGPLESDQMATHTPTHIRDPHAHTPDAVVAAAADPLLCFIVVLIDITIMIIFSHDYDYSFQLLRVRWSWSGSFFLTSACARVCVCCVYAITRRGPNERASENCTVELRHSSITS